MKTKKKEIQKKSLLIQLIHVKTKKKENRKLGPCSSFVTHEDKKKKKKLQKNSLLKHIKTKKKKKFANWAHARREQRGSTFWQTQLIFGSIRSGF
jgi:spore germination cell wall hydrolase CwlJ-like protein